jgi:activating signal cointegrator 1
MKAISLWQPWASLWCSPCKIHETRHWPTSHRGWLAVHAAKKLVNDVPSDLRTITEDEFGGHWGMDLPRGCVIGAVHVVACKRTETVKFETLCGDEQCGDFSPGRYAWERDKYFILKHPIPLRGQQSMWTLPVEIGIKLAREAAL